MITKNDLNDVQIIETNGKTYLGIMTEYDNAGTDISHGMVIKELSKSTFAEWLKKENLNELENLKIRGFIACSSRELTEDEKTDFEMCFNIMERARRTALAHVENNIYDKLNK
jgi:hypothetical protein